MILPKESNLTDLTGKDARGFLCLFDGMQASKKIQKLSNPQTADYIDCGFGFLA